MKKLIILGAIAFASMSFAKTVPVKNEVSTVKKETVSATKKTSSARPGQLYFVEFDSPCGHINLTFVSYHPQGSAGFMSDLAYSVNYAASNC